MGAAVIRARPVRHTQFAVVALVMAYGFVSIAVVFSEDVPTTYAATSVGAASADLVAGLGLIAVGAFAWLERSGGSVGLLTALLGVAWLAHDWVGWWDGWAPARSIAMVAAPFLLPLLLHLAFAFPTGRVGSRFARAALVVVYVAASVVSVGWALLRDPFLDLNCWSNCTDNVFLVHADQGLARAFDGFWLRFSVAVAILTAAVVLRRLASATPAGRRILLPVLVPVGLAAGAEAAYAVALLRDPGEVPESPVFRAVFFARALALGCLAAGVAWSVLRDRRTRGAIARLATDLGEGPQPGTLQASLARSLGDAALEVMYWLPGSRRYVDAAGRPVELPDGDQRATTPIVRNGAPVALVVHDPALTGARDLEREIGAAARLAVDNERLRAEVLAQLEDLRASRARIVEAGDSARRRIERDLHDGTQQRLLTLSYELRLARAAAESDGDADLSSTLAASCDEAQAALAELRDLAHGIYPAILTEAGLGPALQTLADEAPLPVEIGDIPDERFSEAVERAAYLVVSGAIATASDHAEVIVQRQGEVLVVSVGPVESAPSVHLFDRVGALGGRLAIEDGLLRAEIPCV